MFGLLRIWTNTLLIVGAFSALTNRSRHYHECCSSFQACLEPMFTVPSKIPVLHCKDTIPKIRNKYSQKKNFLASVSIWYSCVCERIINSQDRSAYSAAGKFVDRSWEYIHRSQNMNVEIGTEAAQFLFWVYINGIFVAVYHLVRLSS